MIERVSSSSMVIDSLPMILWRTHLSSPALTFPVFTSIRATKRNTFPSFCAEARMFSKWSSNSGNRSTKSLPDWIFSRAVGIRDSVVTDA